MGIASFALRVGVIGASLSLTLGLTAPAAYAQSPSPSRPEFRSPYQSPQPLESFIVFSAPPRANVPDGQIHWVDAEVPGIDVHGPDGAVHSMCPGDGLAWTLAQGDVVGGGGQFVAVECQAPAEGWQMLAFHLCEIQIQASISASDRRFTRVPSGAPLARECSGSDTAHSHLSLGYWAKPEAKLELACPQWYVQGRYWVNAACLARAGQLPSAQQAGLDPQEDWELRLLQPDLLAPLRRMALYFVTLGLALYVMVSFARPTVAQKVRPRQAGPGLVALTKSAIVLGFVALLVMISAGPVWPVGAGALNGYATADQPYVTMAQNVGYRDWRLLKAFYQAAIPRTADGAPAPPGVPGKVFPPEAAAAIPFGETNADDWGLIDPTQPGPYGHALAWDAVAERWPPSLYERVVLRQSLSSTAQRERAGLTAIAASPALQALGRRLGKTIRAEDLYGSAAGAVGRTQLLPEHFAPGGVCADVPSGDVWNDPQAVAECTTRYLTVSGCWGSWWANGDVWSALCGYNPGAWDVDQHQWYWTVLQDRMTRLTAAERSSGAAQPDGSAPAGADSVRAPETLVPTPVLGLLMAQSMLQGGQGADRLPGPLPAALAALGPQVQTPEQRTIWRAAYRVFRAWVLIYYSPEELLTLGVQL